ncbi:MAG TPA: transcription termination factor Rho, partial [Planctomycetota bacterium]|nr:transcription termination factor Rho [Planctomycetota bacterium]
ADDAHGAAVATERGPRVVEGLLIVDKGGHGKLRQRDKQWMPDRKHDPHVSPRLIQKYALREGSILRGRVGRGQGQHKYDLVQLESVDGRSPEEVKSLVPFKRLTSIDPDFHYEVGDFTKDTSLRVIDLICPVGRGQRGLIVAPPRSGKTILLQKFAKAVEEHYPDVHLMVLLVDERPEEATEWKRSIKGDVFVSTNDELPKVHVELAESVWKRCVRLVELGEDVVLLLDSITRLARAYNHVHGTSGKTMSGGIDSRTMERPKQFFGSARNTETAGSLTILGTCLIETGSKMDQVIFEEFKGTGNMELVLSRKLADRRIFPAIDVEKSGTRKEEKLLSATRLRRITTLRRVLARMHWAEAMELLITKLDDIERNDDFLKRFDVDPEV